MALGIIFSSSFSWIIRFFSTRTLPPSLETCCYVFTPNIFSWPLFLSYFSTQYYAPLCSKNPRKDCFPCCRKPSLSLLPEGHSPQMFISSTPWKCLLTKTPITSMLLNLWVNSLPASHSTHQLHLTQWITPSPLMNGVLLASRIPYFLLWSSVKAVSLSDKSPTFKLWNFKDANVCSIKIRRDWCCILPSVSSCYQSFSSTISHLRSLPQSVTLLACSLHASPWIPAVMLSFCIL